MSPRSAEKWLGHMLSALDDMKDEINSKYRKQLFDFLKYTAYFLILCQTTQKEMETERTGT
jgi:truncated hemoglobin YjbI